MALFSNYLGKSTPGSATLANSNPQAGAGSLFGKYLGTQPAADPGALGGTVKLGTAILSSLGGSAEKLLGDIYKTSKKPVKSWGDLLDVGTQTMEEATRPARAMIQGIGQAAIGAVSMPIQSGIQAATGKSTSYSLPWLGKFDSYQDMKSQLQPTFGKSVAATFPLIQEGLNMWLVGDAGFGAAENSAIKNIANTDDLNTIANNLSKFKGIDDSQIPRLANELKDVDNVPDVVKALKKNNLTGSPTYRLFKDYLPTATPAPAVVRFFGNETKNLNPEDLGTFDNMTKLEAAKEKLLDENPRSINIPEMVKSGMTPEQAQGQALQTMTERAQSISPQEHLNEVYKIATTMGETPADVAKSLPNFLEKSRTFQTIAPILSKATGIPIEQMVLLRDDTLTNVDVDEMIDKVNKEKFTSNMNIDNGLYKNIISKLYAEYPSLEFYHNHLEPQMMAGGTLDELGMDTPVEGFKGKQDLIDRLNQIKQLVNHEITVPDKPGWDTSDLNDLRSQMEDLGQGTPRGYKVGFSPLEYTPMIPKDYVPLPEQNFLGKTFDALGLNEVDKRTIQAAWKNKFNTEFAKAFPDGIVDDKGDTLDLNYKNTAFKKSGAPIFGGDQTILDKLMDIAKAKNDISVTEISRKDLATIFGKDAADKLGQVLAESRVLPANIEGAGLKLVNQMRTNPFLDEFYKYTLSGRFGYSTGYAIRHYVKNQILGAFEGKPLNILGFANTDAGEALAERLPTIFGGVRPTADELSTVKKIIGNTSISLSPADEAWVYSHMGDALQNLAVKEAIESPNWIEKALGYTQTQDVVDLMRTYAKKNGTTLSDIADDPVMSSELKGIVKQTYSYGEGVVSSPAMKTLNQIFYPVRFEAKVMQQTAKWWMNAPMITRSTAVSLFNQGVINSNSAQSKAFLKKNSIAINILSYLVPYSAIMNSFGDAVSAVGTLDTPSKALGSAYNAVADNYQIGGLMFGLLLQQAQNQGIIPQTEYVDPAGKKYPIYIPKGIQARVTTFLGTWLNFMWPSGSKILSAAPGSIGTEFNKLIPEDASYLPASQKRKIQPGQVVNPF